MQKAVIDTNIIIRLAVNDDDKQREACIKLLERAKNKELMLYILPVAVFETVWILEKFYKLPKKKVRDFVEALLNTPEIICDMENVLKQAIAVYEEKNIKFADAVMGYWGLEKGISDIFTYDERDFRRIEGLKVHKP
ncbi:MAG: PIN domain-containing protein [Thermodesulfovibrionales bacterium]